MTSPATLDVVRSAVRAVTARPAATPALDAKPTVKPVVTISREAGIDPTPLAHGLVEALNRLDDADPPWIDYDRKLVERVAEDHNIEADLVASLDEHDKTWFEHLTAGLTGAATGTDIAMKTARTIRALARIGRAVIVGRGGQSILFEFPHAVHVRLIAPAQWRVDRYVEAKDGSPREAERALRELDSDRASFIKSHFGHDVLDLAHYHVVLNVARIEIDCAVELLVRMVEAETAKSGAR